MHHHDFGDGRYVLRLDAGDEIIQSLQRFAADVGVTAGYVVGFGATSELTLGFLDQAEQEYVKRRFQEPMEIGNATGSFSMDGDNPSIHLHAVAGPRELLAYAGHVHRGVVDPVMELFVTALPGRLERREVADQPFRSLVLPGEPTEEGDPGR